MIKKSHARHIPHYLPLVGMFTAGILAFLFFSYDKQFQVGVAVSLAIGHVTWGIVHHTIHRDLSVGIVLEYMSVAVLGLVVVLTVILRE
ncbi:hypothetical protein C4564_00935 [Candidatus Microgenomates bacterium]|nr:MAG: hypothetical protein C4564_00935 [Candidatus Microgenomates bacterium]